MAGDFNTHLLYPPPPADIGTLHSLQNTLKVRAKRTLDTQQSRASTAAHVKMTLESLCNRLQANKAVIFEGLVSQPSAVSEYLCLAFGTAVSSPSESTL